MWSVAKRDVSEVPGGCFATFDSGAGGAALDYLLGPDEERGG